MRLLYLVDQYKPECYTGTVKFAETIVDYFGISNDVLLVSYCENTSNFYKSYSDVQYWSEKIDGKEYIKFSTVKKSDINYTLYNKDVYNFAIHIIKEFKPDIVHICHPRRVSSFIKAAIDTNTKYVITFTDNYLICRRSFLFTKSCKICTGRHKENICEKECGISSNLFNSKLLNDYIHNAYSLVAPSNFQAGIYEEYFDRHVRTINHGNNIKGIIKSEKTYPKEKLIFLFNGSSITIKGLLIAIEAFNKLNSKIDVELHVYGNCDDVVKIIAGDNIKFYGRYDNSKISEILDSADMVICPSIWYENHPFVITEAFMHNVPVLASNEGGMKELIKNCVNGFLYDLGDYNHLAQVIQYIYNNQSIIKGMKDNLKKYHCETVENEMEQYKDIYENAINNIDKIEKKSSVIESAWLDIIKSKFEAEDDLERYFKCINYVSEKYNYFINIDLKYRFIIRLKNMENILRNNNKKEVVIWGTGMSGLLTIQILRMLYSDINIKSVVDKYKAGEKFEGIKVEEISKIDNYDFNYLFICTSPGKSEGDDKMRVLNKKVNFDYNYGICIE